MNSQTANAVLKRIGFEGKLAVHGLRSIASTYFNEQGLNSNVIEACIAHTDKNEVRKSYNCATYFIKRKDVMEKWSNIVSIAESKSIPPCKL